MLSSPYSVRSALMGEIVAAWPAGMTAAKNLQPTSDPAATDRAKGSQNDTPYSCDAMSFATPTARSRPTTSPAGGHPMKSLAQNQLDHVDRVRTECHPDAEFVRLPRDHIRRDAVHAD